MSIGEKIKNVRTSKMLTQKDLAGDTITRNMLSKIENGVATPSLPVAIMLAEKLGVPVGYLLTDTPEEEARFRKYSSYSNIVHAYRIGEWAICRQLALECLGGKKDDQELIYFATQSALQMGIEEFDAGNLRLSCVYFDEALGLAQDTVLDGGITAAKIGPYVDFMGNISPTLGIDVSLPDRCDLTYNCDFAVYSSLFGGEADREYSWENENFGLHLEAMRLMENEKYAEAAEILERISADISLPVPVRYFICADYEKCCSETGNYKTAYEMSQNKIRILEKMLSSV